MAPTPQRADANQSVENLAPVLTSEGFGLLESLPADAAMTEDAALATNLALRKAGHDPEVVTAVVHQARLRALAGMKFGPFAEHMMLTRAGLEQATRMSVAALHAQRFVKAGFKRVADLGCGLGADAMAMATLELDVTAVELDETTAAAATVNLMPWPNARVVQGDATEFDLEGFDAVWLDPARRTTSTSGTSRVFDPEAFSPPLSYVESLSNAGLPVGVKLGPGIPHESIPEDCEAQWVSVEGSVTEVALWFGPLARPGVKRAALVLSADGAAELTSEKHDDVPAEPEISEIRDYLYEPDGAVIRAGLVREAMFLVGGHLLDPHIAYFTAETAEQTPFARAYKVLDVMPYNIKSLKRWVKDNGIGVLDIKKRGVDVTPEELRKILLAGSGRKAKGKATLILTRIGDWRVAINVEPV
ncbi:class I SAM-dependent methyltransferase [Zhihengliuella halotolerans]|uniref:Methyltransferase family protein n=1 Tax=Zhihengliuella halotolerans TaxID=370736 RepID=A0A4Q8AA78_9MICC|nr:class I SAM-dependent methyltransferase [Zhihengliuella halotolerans]RZU60864.1 methyltransferase family protein [Zhihengliuella halotolerans]